MIQCNTDWVKQFIYFLINSGTLIKINLKSMKQLAFYHFAQFKVFFVSLQYYLCLMKSWFNTTYLYLKTLLWSHFNSNGGSVLGITGSYMKQKKRALQYREDSLSCTETEKVVRQPLRVAHPALGINAVLIPQIKMIKPGATKFGLPYFTVEESKYNKTYHQMLILLSENHLKTYKTSHTKPDCGNEDGATHSPCDSRDNGPLEATLYEQLRGVEWVYRAMP